MFCTECGHQVEAGKYCTSCGVQSKVISDHSSDAESAQATLPISQISPTKSNGNSVAKALGWLLFVPTILFLFPAVTFLTDGNCQWVTATQEFSPATLFTGNALFCMYAEDEYSAKLEAAFMGLAPDKLWMSNSTFLVTVFTFVALTTLLLYSGRKQK